jgi:catecholate siderophore receptor
MRPLKKGGGPAMGRLKHFLPVMLVAICASLSVAQEAVRSTQLHLRVVDESGAAIAGASIEVMRPGEHGVVVAGASTDGRGDWVRHLSPGEYVVRVQHEGFQPDEDRVDVGEGVTELRMTLRVARRVETIEARTEGYLADQETTAAKVPLRLAETPQQIEVLTGELLQARAAESMKQAMEMVPAAGLQLGEGRRDNFYIRGFNAVGDVYVDGVRDTAQYYRDLSNTERIEVLEGPAAVLYGRGSSGGLINRVTKRPQMEGTLGELSYAGGSYGEQRGTADLDMLVPGSHNKLGFRITGAAEHEGSHRHQYWIDRYAFAPTLLWKPDSATEVRAGVERLRDDRLPDRGIPYLPSTGAPASVPVGNYYGYVGSKPGSNFIHTAVTAGSVDVRHVFGDGWTAHAQGRLAGYTTNFANVYASGIQVRLDGGTNVLRGEYHGAQNWRVAYGSEDASRSGRWLRMRHTLLIGVEQGLEATDATQNNGPTNQTPVDLLNPALLAPVLNNVLSRNNHFTGSTQAVYAQDLASIGGRWKVLAGARVDRFGQRLEFRPPTNTVPNLSRVDWAASPRVGVVYALKPSASAYGNYTRTFDPSGENLSLAANNAELKPEVTENYEGGMKWELLRQRLLLTASVFRLDRTNIKTTDPNDPTALLNLGEQRTDGAELNGQGELTRHWRLYGGYAWLDGRIVSSTTLSSGVLLQGRRPAMTAQHNTSLWTSYEFARGFGVAAGIVGKSAQFAATDNLARLPRYVRMDASAFYRAARYDVQVNIQNVGNRRFYDAAQSDYQIYPAAPISGSATVRYRF